MTLLTPPHTRPDKENRRVSHSKNAHVAWSQVNEYHSVTSPACTRKLATSASKELPRRSILKQTSYPILPLPFPENEREVTPEPSNPLSDLHYLDSSVNKILGPCSTLPDLIEAYSILTARLRGAVNESTDSACSWPLFQPLRKRRMEFVDAIVRDLGRALIDPMEGSDQLGCPIPEPSSALPSPEKSPRKRRCGMDDEQAKYARDLATVSHATIKFLGLVFTLPAVYNLFDDGDLGSMVTQALAIPLAPELPTPNARKTCALAIWLLQTQQLPADILAPAKDRITYALRRAVEGELGKEGKKGAASDGLKAIHDLSIHEPSIFVPAFTELLPSILDNLLAPRLALRAQACHALGGLALGASQIPLSYTHTRLSETVAAALTAVPPPSSTSSPSTPSAGKSDCMLIKTLRTTLGAHDPTCAAQGPAWALCTLAALIVLLGPTLVTNAKLTNVVKALLALSVRHRKSSVRGLACALWRPLAWVYFRRPLPRRSDEEGEDEEWEDERTTTNVPVWTQAEEARRDEFWKVVVTMVDMGAGVGTIAALLARKSDDVRGVSRAIALLETMVQRGGNMCHDAVQTLCRLVSTPSGTSPSPSPQEGDADEEDWVWAKLLPTGLFCADPGLLTIEFASLSEEVRKVIKQTPTVDDVRTLSAAELWRPGVMDGLIRVWRTALTQVCLSSDAVLPPELVQAWNGLLKAALRGLQGSTDSNDDEDSQNDDELVQKLAELVVSLMQEILGDPNVQLVPSGDAPTPSHVDTEIDLAPHTRSNAAMKLAVVRGLWTQAHAVLPARALAASPSEALLMWLMEKEPELVWETDTPHDARTQWAMLCAEVLLRTGTTVGCASAATSHLRVFWGTRGASRSWVWNWSTDVRARVWRVFAERWRTLAEGWEEAPVLLCVPFADKDEWEMSTEDLDAWDATLQVCLARVLDDGGDATRVLDHLAGTIASMHIPTGASATRAAELLLSHLDAPPDAPALLGFVNDTLVSTYPPEPQNKVASMWLIRAATRVVDTCSVKKLREVVGALQEGLSVWVADQYRVLTAEEYAFDVVPLYQTTMVCLQSLGSSTDVLKTLGPLLEAGFTGRDDKPPAIVDAFRDYWDLTYAELTVPRGGWPSSVVTCLQACGRNVLIEPTPLPAETGDVALSNKRNRVSTLEPAFTWGSSSTIAGDEDDASDATETSQESNPFVVSTKEVERPSTPKAALAVSSPQRPSKTATVRRTDIVFSPLAPTTLDFVVAPASPSTPSRQPRTPLIRSPKKPSDGSDKENSPPKPPALPSVLERIAMSTPVGGSAVKLGKRRASNTPLADLRPAKKTCGDFASENDDDSDAECEEVQRCLLRLVTPSPAANQPQLQAFAAFSSVPCALPLPTGPSRSPSPSPTPVRHHRNRKRKGVFMDAVEVPTPKPRQQAPRRTQPRRRCASIHMTHQSSTTTEEETTTSLRPPPSSPSGPAARRGMRRAKSLGDELIAGVGTPARVAGKRQRPGVAIMQTKTKPTAKNARMESDDVVCASADPSSSSPISASLKRARVLFGSDDSMAAEMDLPGGVALELCESSDDDPHGFGAGHGLGRVTAHQIFSPAPRRMSSRFFAVHDEA